MSRRPLFGRAELISLGPTAGFFSRHMLCVPGHASLGQPHLLVESVSTDRRGRERREEYGVEFEVGRGWLAALWEKRSGDSPDTYQATLGDDGGGDCTCAGGRCARVCKHLDGTAAIAIAYAPLVGR